MRRPSGHHDRRRQRHSAPHGGAILLCVMICLCVVMLMLAQLVRTTLATRQRLRAERDARQCDWLAESGVRRSLDRRQHDPQYTGEIWEWTADAAAGLSAGRVTIAIPSAPLNGQSMARVVAEYPTNRAVSVRKTRLITLTQRP